MRTRAGRQQLRIGPVPAPLELHPARPEQRNKHLERLLESTDSMVERKAEGIEFRLVPSAPQAQDQAPTAHLVERARHLGHQRGVPEREG